MKIIGNIGGDYLVQMTRDEVAMLAGYDSDIFLTNSRQRYTIDDVLEIAGVYKQLKLYLEAETRRKNAVDAVLKIAETLANTPLKLEHDSFTEELRHINDKEKSDVAAT